MPAHNINLKEPESLARLLLALILDRGGEVRLKASVYDSVDRGRLLVADYDRQTGELVLRSTSDFASVIVVQPESYRWTKPIEPSERPETSLEQRTARITNRSDEELAALESQRSREAELARELKEQKLPPRLRRPAEPQA